MKDLQITMMPDGWMEKTGGYAKDMTLRDAFALAAMQGMCAGLKSGDKVEHVPAFAYLMADAMLKAGQ